MTSGFALSPAIIAAVRPPSSHERFSSVSVNRHKAIISSSLLLTTVESNAPSPSRERSQNRGFDAILL
ncbi:unnamed protein product [Cochlearia groenlandica]